MRRKTKRGAVVVVERRFEDGAYLYRRFRASRSSLARLARVTALFRAGLLVSPARLRGCLPVQPPGPPLPAGERATTEGERMND